MICLGWEEWFRLVGLVRLDVRKGWKGVVSFAMKPYANYVSGLLAVIW